MFVIMKRIDDFLLPFLPGNAINDHEKDRFFFKTRTLTFEENSHTYGTIEARAIQSFNAVGASQMEPLLAQRTGGHDRTLQGTRR